MPTDTAGLRKPIRRFWLGVSAVACLAGQFATAEAAPEAPRDEAGLVSYISTDYYVERLTTYLVGYETWVGPCPDPQPLQLVGTYLQERSLPLPGGPDAGALQWVEQVRVSGCEVPYERFVLVSVSGDVPVFHARLLGNTQTSPRLEHEAVERVVEQEHENAVRAGCERVSPLRILAAAFEGSFDTEYGEGWHETWTVLDCNGARDLRLTFRPDHSGGTSIAILPLSSEGQQ